MIANYHHNLSHSMIAIRYLIKSAFHSNKTSENFETKTNGADFFLKSLQNFRKLLNSRKPNYSTENIGNSARKAKWNGFLLPRKVVLFSWNSKTAVPFVAENLRQEIQTGIFHRMENALTDFTCAAFSRNNATRPHFNYCRFPLFDVRAR